MKVTLQVFSALLKNWLRSRTSVFFSFLFPVVLLIIFGTVFGGGVQKYDLWVQNLDLENGGPSPLSSALISSLENSGIFSVKTLSSHENVVSWIKGNPSFTRRRALLIPENFGRNLASRGIYLRTGMILNTLELFLTQYGGTMDENQLSAVENGKIVLEEWMESLTTENAGLLLLMEEGDSAAPVISGAVYSLVQAFSNSIVGTEQVIEVRSITLSEKSLRATDYYMPGYLAAFIMTNGVIGVTSMTSEFRRNGILKRMAATPLRKRSWIFANLLLQVFLAFSLAVVMILLSYLLFGTQGIPNFFSILLLFLGAVAFCAIGVTLGGMIRDIEAAVAAGNLIAFPMMFLSGAFWPVEMMSGFMQTVAKCMPLYYFHEGLRQAMIFGNTAGSLPSLLVLAVLSLVFVPLAVKVTRWKDLH